MKEPQVTVGIMSERQIRFVFNGTYLANGVPVSGEHEAHTDGKQIFWNGNRYTRIVFTPEKRRLFVLSQRGDYRSKISLGKERRPNFQR